MEIQPKKRRAGQAKAQAPAPCKATEYWLTNNDKFFNVKKIA